MSACSLVATSISGGVGVRACTPSCLSSGQSKARLPACCACRRELLRPSASVALHRHSNALVDILPPEADSTISVMSQTERPDVTYQVRLGWIPGGEQPSAGVALLVKCARERRAAIGESTGVGWSSSPHCRAMFCV